MEEVWLEYCNWCKRKHYMSLQDCSGCGEKTSQPCYENIAETCMANNLCVRCEAHQDHISEMGRVNMTFKVGDTVECIADGNYPHIINGKQYIVSVTEEEFIGVGSDRGAHYLNYRFKLAKNPMIEIGKILTQLYQHGIHGHKDTKKKRIDEALKAIIELKKELQGEKWKNSYLR